MKGNKKSENGITLVALIITIIILIILAAVTIKVVTDMKIIQFAIKGTEDYSKAQDKEIEDFGKIENLLTDTISNIESGNTPTNPNEPEEPVNNPFTEADIGKYVNYVPVGADYTAQAKYSGTFQLDPGKYLEYNIEQTFKQDTSLKWKIWKVENDTLYLISDEVPKVTGYNNTGNLVLAGSQGYNNGVTLLDRICQSNYGINGNMNVKVQNLKLEDVLEVKAEKVQNQAGEEYETQPETYPSSGSFAFPNIWYNNERINLDAAQGNKSKAYEIVEESDTTILASAQSPYFTKWFQDMNTSDKWKKEEYWNMVMNRNAYWLSTRYVQPISYATCHFGLQMISSPSITSASIYDYMSGNNRINPSRMGIRPLVSIPLKNCEITPNSTTANTFDIVIK